MTPATSGRLSESLERLEADLHALWDADASRARAYTLNLVAVAGEAVHDSFAALVDDVATRLLARTFIITVDPRAEPWSLAGEVTAVCQLGEREICAERIELAFGVVAAKRAGSVIEALAESRLSTVMLVGEAAHGDVVDALAPACSRVVVDSALAGVARAAHVADLARGEVGDLAFVRGRRWREMLARLFDDPERTPALGSVRLVELCHVDAGRTAEADLLLGWLGSRLGWVAAPHMVRDAGMNPVEIRLESVERPDVAPGCLESVAIHADGIVARVTRDRDAQHLRCFVETADGTTTSHHFAIPHRDRAEEVARAVSEIKSEGLARAALAFAATWRGPG